MDTLTDRHPAGLADVTADAAARGLDIEFFLRDPNRHRASRADDAVVAKTIVVQRGQNFLFVLVPLTARFSWAKLRAVAGTQHLTLPDSSTVVAATGYEPGAVTPIGASTAWPVIIDAGLAGRRIALSGGSRGVGLRIDTNELVDAYAARVIDLSAEPDAFAG
nr:YbaK/EbsC family protein [Propionicimonas sp.]